MEQTSLKTNPINGNGNVRSDLKDKDHHAFLPCSSSSAEEMEPKLKYERLGNSMKTIMENDAVSCVACNLKIICIGTRCGLVYVLDHQGTKAHVECLQGQLHTLPVNQISLDVAGEYVATCSNDGQAYVCGLYTADHRLQFTSSHSIHSVAIDPLYHRLGMHQRFVTGDSRLLLHRKYYFGTGLRTSVLFESASPVLNLKWCNRFVACACRDNVRIYDIEERTVVGIVQWWDSPPDSYCPWSSPQLQYPCCITWHNSTRLLFGRLHTFRVCHIEKRCSILNVLKDKKSPSFAVSVVATLTVDDGHHICGVCPLDVSQLIMLGCASGCNKRGAALPPRMCFFQQTADGSLGHQQYAQVYSDTLAMHSYHEYTCGDYWLEYVPGENCFIIACPRDVIVANAYNNEERVEWLVSHSRFEQAFELVMAKRQLLRPNTSLAVAKKYLDYLLARHQYARAGQICAQVLGNDVQQWVNVVFRFSSVGQLHAISPYLPLDPQFALDSRAYQMVLHESTKKDAQHFWNIIRQRFLRHFDVDTATDALAELTIVHQNTDAVTSQLSGTSTGVHSGQPYKTVNLYLAIRNKVVFDFIRKHELKKSLIGKANALMELDAQQAIHLFLEKERLPPDLVVSELQQNEYHLYLYLDALSINFKREARKYQPLLVKLYAKFWPEKLRPLLKRSRNYSFHEAVATCEEHNLHLEAAYLWDRMGNTSRALQLVVNQIGDIKQALRLCVKHNDMDLWEDLVKQSVARPEFVKYLLEKIGRHVDAAMLIRRMRNDTQIPGLKNLLQRILQQRRLQVSIATSHKNIVYSDRGQLHTSFVRMLKCGYSIDKGSMCSGCNQNVICQDRGKILFFYCRHTFHEECLPPSIDNNNNVRECFVCFSQKNEDAT